MPGKFKTRVCNLWSHINAVSTCGSFHMLSTNYNTITIITAAKIVELFYLCHYHCHYCSYGNTGLTTVTTTLSCRTLLSFELLLMVLGLSSLSLSLLVLLFMLSYYVVVTIVIFLFMVGLLPVLSVLIKLQIQTKY